VADLKGKRLAPAKRAGEPIDFWRAAALRAYVAALATEGLTLDDVELVEVAVQRSYIDSGRLVPAVGADSRLATGGDLQREEVFALLRGEVDAIYSQSSFAGEVVAFTGAIVVYDVGQHPEALEQANNALPEAFTVSAGLIEREFEAVATVIAHAIASADWARSHKREAVRIIAAEQRVAEETVEVAYGPNIHQHLEIDLSRFRRAALARRKDSLLRHGFLAADFDLEAWIDPRPLARALEIVERWRAETPEVAAVA